MLSIIGKTPAIIHFAHILTIMDLSGESVARCQYGAGSLVEEEEEFLHT